MSKTLEKKANGPSVLVSLLVASTGSMQTFQPRCPCACASSHCWKPSEICDCCRGTPQEVHSVVGRAMPYTNFVFFCLCRMHLSWSQEEAGQLDDVEFMNHLAANSNCGILPTCLSGIIWDVCKQLLTNNSHVDKKKSCLFAKFVREKVCCALRPSVSNIHSHNHV